MGMHVYAHMCGDLKRHPDSPVVAMDLFIEASLELILELADQLVQLLPVLQKPPSLPCKGQKVRVARLLCECWGAKLPSLCL